MLLGGRSANIVQHNSHGFPATATPIHQDDDRLIKDWQPPAPVLGGKEVIVAPNSISLSYNYKRFPKSPIEYVDWKLDENLKKNERIAKFLRPSVAKLNFELFSNPNLFPKPLLFPNGQNISYQSLVDLTGDPIQSSKIMFLPNGKVLFRGNTMELEDYMAIVADMFRFKSFEQERTKTYLVPPLYRFNDDDDVKEIVAAPETVAPPLSPEKTKGKKQRKKKGKRSISGERDVHKRSYFHACESLLTIMMGANQRHGRDSLVSVVRSAPEIPALLTQMSACIAGTGLAVLFFSVAWMVNSSFMGISASKCVSLGLGLGLMWVAWGVIKLRDAIASIGKSSGDVVADVGGILKDIYFRFAVLLGLVVLKFG